jgi:Mg2+ and Co2+ transporter CorA
VFKGESHITTSYSSQINTIPTDVNNYYDVFKYLTGKDIYDVPSADPVLNSLITTYAVLDFMYKFKNIYKDQGLAKKERNKQYINEINKNLKTEVDKYQHINALVKRSVKNTKNHYNNLYLTTLYYRDIVYLLIYLTIISILLNVIFIEFGFNYSDKRVLGLYIFLFILGIVIYSYRYLIRVKTNPRNRYF